MAPIELQKALETANEKDNNKELFSDKDLTAFTDLIAKKEDFDVLVKWFEDEKTIKEIEGIKGLKDSIDAFIKTKTGLADIFGKKYEDMTDNKDIYEVCVLGAILSKGKVEKANYQTLGKEYYDSISTKKIEAKETNKPNIEGTYLTASSDMKTETITKIENTTKIEEGKNITEASVSVSAGADLRKMDETKAKKIYDNKMNTLAGEADKFTNTENKKQVTDIVAELKKSDKIENISKDQTDQKGNQYLIGARIAEGFIQALEKLTLTPEPTLKLTIDRENCVIGKSTTNTDIETDRFINMNLNLTVVASTTEQKHNVVTVKPGSNGNNGITIDKTPKNGNNNQGGTWWSDETIENGTNKGKGPDGNGYNTHISSWEKEKTQPEVKEGKESAETLQLRQDIADHFTFKTWPITAQDVSDVVQDTKDKSKYTISIKGYTDVMVSYTGENIEIAKGIVKKWLLKWDIKEAKSVKIDRVSKDRSKITKDITIDFNAAKSKDYINSKLSGTTSGDQGKYEVKNDADVKESNVKVQYTNDKILKPNEKNEAIMDNINLSLDSDYMINKGKDQSIPLERQKSQGDKEKVNCIKPYKIDDETTKITYYGRTLWGTKDPSITIINNIIKIQEEANGNISKAPIFNEYINLSKQNKTFEEYSKKVMLQYDTPKVTSIENQFWNTAAVEYKNDKYNITTTFDIPGKKALTLTLPINYIPGSATNQNTSSVQYGNKPELSWTDEFNKIDKGVVMIDGIVYDIGVANQQQKNIPNIYFRHIEEKTLINAKEWTKPYKIESNSFWIKNVNEQVQWYDKVNAWFGNCEFGLLSVKDNKWSDPITYFKDVNVGQVKDGNLTLLKGTKIGTMYFDQHGKFLEYKTNDQQMTFDKQTNKVDLAENTPIGVKEPLGKSGKNLLIKQTMNGTILNVDILNPDDAYTGKKTGTEFVKTQDPEKAKDMDNYFYTSAETKLMIGESRIAVYEGLKKISSEDIEKKSRNLFNYVTEVDKIPNKVLGPDRKGVFAYQLIKANGEYPAQYIYCKVNNKNITLCNADGEQLDQQKIFLEANDDYYNIKINDNEKEFTIIGKNNEKQSKMPVLDISTDKEYDKYAWDIKKERHCGYRSAKKDDENSYQFMGDKYTSFDVNIKGEKVEGKDKIEDLSTFSLINENEEGFWSYNDFFITEHQKTLWIDEKTYQEVFSKVIQEKETNKDNLVKVKYKKGDKFYYMPMNLEVIKRWGKTTFDMTPSKGWEEAIKETEKRLENLVKAYSVFLEQDISTVKEAKGDIIQGWYLVKPTAENRNKYFKDPSQNTEMVLKTNNKTGDIYQEEKLVFNPQKETLDKKEITINKIKYSLSIKTDSKMWYRIVVHKGEAEK